MKTPRWVASLALPHLFALLAVHRTALAVPLLNPNRIATEFDHYFASNSAANAVDPSNFQHGVPNLDLSLHPPVQYDYPQGVDGHHGYGAPHQPVEYNFQQGGDGHHGHGAHDLPVPYNFQQGVDGQYGHPDHSLFVPVQSEYQQGAGTQHGHAALHGSAASSHENAYSDQQTPRPFSRGFGFGFSELSTQASTPRPPDHQNSWGGAFRQAEGSSRPRSKGKARLTSSRRTADTSINHERLDETSLSEHGRRVPSDPRVIRNPAMLEAVRDAVVKRLNDLESQLLYGPREWRGGGRIEKGAIAILPPAKDEELPLHALKSFRWEQVAPHLFGDISVNGYEVKFTAWRSAPKELQITGMRLYNIVARKDSGRGPNEPEKYYLGAIHIPEEWTHAVQQPLKGKLVWVPFDRANNYKPDRKRYPDLPSYDKK